MHVSADRLCLQHTLCHRDLIRHPWFSDFGIRDLNDAVVVSLLIKPLLNCTCNFLCEQIVENWFYDYYNNRRAAPARSTDRERFQGAADDKYGGSYDDLDEKPSWSRGRK